MLSQTAIEQSYCLHLERAAHYYHLPGEDGNAYNFYRGAAHGVGTVLDYEYERIEKDIAAAIEAAKTATGETEDGQREVL